MKEVRLTIGERERHELQVHYGQMSRRVYITLDDKRVDEIMTGFAGRHVTSSRISVGDMEVHQVEVRVISGLFGADIQVIVDGKLLHTL